MKALWLFAIPVAYGLWIIAEAWKDEKRWRKASPQVTPQQEEIK